MYFAVLVITFFTFNRFSFANELLVKMNAEESTCTAQCSRSCTDDDHNDDDLPHNRGAIDPCNACKDALNESCANAKSLKEVKASVASLLNDVESLKHSTNITTALVSDVLSRLEELIIMYNESRYDENPTSDKKHIEIKGVRFTRFWWYNNTSGKGWPSGETDVLGKPYGACDENNYYCFGRLPQTLDEASSELLAVDSAGNIYKWKFNPSNSIAHSAWRAFYSHVDQKVLNGAAWNPEVIQGSPQPQTQDSFMYRSQNGVKSVLLDDDNCDCLSTLSMGHGMCGTGFSTTYGPENRFGVDLLPDGGCSTPNPAYGLTLYFKG